MKASCGATRHYTREYKRTPGRPPKVEPVYIACADLDFTWTAKQVKRAVEIYRECSPLEAVRRIADEFRRRDEEAGILIISLALQGVI